MFDAERKNKKATPFYEIFAEAFDLADPDLWKSNSFAMVRPRLLLEVQAVIARLEYELHEGRTKKYRRWLRDPEAESKLRRAREILALLEEAAR
jgi:hypothetical protein